MASWAEHSEKNEYGTDLTEANDRTREAWRCDHCQTLMFLKDKNGRPTAGAPAPKYGSTEYPQVCTLCFQMRLALEQRPGTYWSTIHNKWRAARKNEDKLKPGEDYFAR